MAKSKNEKYEQAAANYTKLSEKYGGDSGYRKGVEAAQREGVGFADSQINKGNEAGLNAAGKASTMGTSLGISNARVANMLGESAAKRQNELANSEAQKYAAQQARATAAGAQGQATTAARAAGMNKAQAAMMGSQQNANAYQNAYGNAYSQQMGQTNNAYENNANRGNQNIYGSTALTAQQMNNATNTYGQNMANQQTASQSAGGLALGAGGTMLGAAMQEGQNEYNRKWGNWGNALGIVGSGLGAVFSDERLKHYRECSKKVVLKSPKKISELKYVNKEGR